MFPADRAVQAYEKTLRFRSGTRIGTFGRRNGGRIFLYVLEAAEARKEKLQQHTGCAIYIVERH